MSYILNDDNVRAIITPDDTFGDVITKVLDLMASAGFHPRDNHRMYRYLIGFVDLKCFNLNDERDTAMLNQWVQAMGQDVELTIKPTSYPTEPSGKRYVDVMIYRPESPVWQLYNQESEEPA